MKGKKFLVLVIVSCILCQSAACRNNTNRHTNNDDDQTDIETTNDDEGTDDPSDTPDSKSYKYLIITSYDQNGTPYSVLEQAFDADGNMIKEASYGDFETASGGLELINYTTYEYDKNGNQTKEIRYDKDGSERLHVEYEYDSAGNKTKQTSFSGGVSGGYRYEYDGSGNELRVYQFNSDKEYLEVESEYDSKGNKIKTTMYDANGNVLVMKTAEFDSSGNPVKITSYTKGVLTEEENYMYDVQGNVTEFALYNAKGEVKSYYRCEREYDSNGNTIKYVRYDKKSRITNWEESEYDFSGNPIKIINYKSDGSVSDWSVKEYDFFGDPTKTTSYNADGTISGWREYEYRNEPKDITNTGTSSADLSSQDFVSYLENDGYNVTKLSPDSNNIIETYRATNADDTLECTFVRYENANEAKKAFDSNYDYYSDLYGNNGGYVKKEDNLIMADYHDEDTYSICIVLDDVIIISTGISSNSDDRKILAESVFSVLGIADYLADDF